MSKRYYVSMRLFTAIELSDELKKELVRIQDSLKDKGVFGGYTKPDNLHLTLAFIGEYGNPDRILDIMEMVRFEPIDLKLDRLGNFGDLYWIGIKADDELERMVKRLRRAFSDNNIPFDRKKFYPHITVVRGAFYDGKGLPEIDVNPVDMTASYISLMRSDHGKNGMVYTSVGEIFADGYEE